MKKLWKLCGISTLMLCLSACSDTGDLDAQNKILEDIVPGSTTTSSTGNREKVEVAPMEGVDIDLAQLSSTMVYSEVYQMMFTPEEYDGKTIRIMGEFFVYTHPDTGKHYFTCVVADALACCQQGIEFVLPEGKTYPEDFPPVGSYVMIVGEFKMYEEFDYTYFHLADAEFL